MHRNQTSKAVFSLLLALVLLCSGCSSSLADAHTSAQRFSRTDLSAFDTVITLVAFAPDQASFDRAADRAFEKIQLLDHIFDGYNAYDDLHNLFYVNLHAAHEPVTVPDDLFQLISWCKEQWNAGYRTVNIAMGAVLSIWHEYREAGNADPEHAQLPPMEELRAAAEHVNFDDVILDADKRTVYFADPLLKLDIGAVGKGWAADRVAPYLYENMPSFILNLGGNVYTGEKPLDGRENWAVAVQDPKADETTLLLGGAQYMDILDVKNLTVVTSGDYWRYYTVDGVRYHHIIDPETLLPSRQMLSVTIVCQSSALADYLSTTLFILPYEAGCALVEEMEGVEALWMLPDGTIRATPGMAAYSRLLDHE